MPNLRHIYELKQKYSNLNSQDLELKEYFDEVLKKDTLRKAFDSGILSETRDVKLFSFVNESISNDKPEVIKYFEENKEEEVTLLFIDITSFSKIIKDWENNKIKEYLDRYYKQIIPIIYKWGGEIEKLMGDGIICVFGKPFMEIPIPLSVYQAEYCAEEVIKKFFNTDKNVKVAIHTDKVHYYKVPGRDYCEYTMIGQAMTELFRLESVSVSNAINFFSKSKYDRFGWEKSIFDVNLINFQTAEINTLQGVDYSEIKQIKFPLFS